MEVYSPEHLGRLNDEARLLTDCIEEHKFWLEGSTGEDRKLKKGVLRRMEGDLMIIQRKISVIGAFLTS